MPEARKPEIGAEVEALCIKCKGATIHVIEVIKTPELMKVMCKACLSSHRYRAANAENTKKFIKAKKVKKPKVNPQTREERKWNRMLDQADKEKAVSYSMNSAFTENDVIDHTKFGVGVVVKILDRGKVTVIFQDGLRNMVQNFKTR
jgi:hypothetical protein